MRRIAILFLFLVVSDYCFGQRSATLDGCMNTAQSQTELNRCASDEAKRADLELNARYKNFLAQIAGDAVAIAKLKAMERVWLHFRDAYIDATYPMVDKQFNYGTEYPMDIDLLRAKLTREHLAALTDLINDYKAP